MSRSGPQSVFSVIIAALCALTLSASAAAQEISETPAQASSSSPAVEAARAVTPTAFENGTLSQINNYRASKGLPTLRVHQKLYLLSKQHSRYMAETGRLSHDGFYDRYLLSGFSTCVENAAWNYPTPASLVRAWRSSPGHNANLLNSRIRYAGMTRVGAYATFFACG